MRLFVCLLISMILCACAGTPPAWWNPSGAYGVSMQEKAAPAPVCADDPSFTSLITPAEEEPMEQDIAPMPDDSYEEMHISPMPDAEELPMNGTVKAEVDTAAAEPAPEQEPVRPEIPQVEENLPEDGSLPMPSVLE